LKGALAVMLFVLAGCATAPAPLATSAPDTGKRAVAERGMVASAHPRASEAGLEMLRAGGNAIDAAVAAAFAIGVVEPMMAGIGGGGSMMIWTQADRRAEYLDFYATAPAGASPEYDRGAHTARLVAVPGAVAGMLEGHERFGRLSREQVLGPAVRLAEDGFAVGSLLARTIADDSAKLHRSPDAARIFWPGGRPLAAGSWLVQPELAATLRRIAAEGRAGFDRGPVAQEIERVLAGTGNPITVDDLAGYTPQWRRPVCAPFRGYTLLAAPPPQSGMQVAQALRMLEPHDLRGLGLPTRSPESAHLLAGAIRVAMADRWNVLGDPRFTPVPADALVSAAHARSRAGMIGGERAPERIAPLTPAAGAEPEGGCIRHEPYAPITAAASLTPAATTLSMEFDIADDTSVGGETTHLAAVDADGNAVSLTYTQGVYFGSGAWAAGTFLNSAMNLFSADASGPNAMLPGRFPASATVPSLVLEGDRVRMVVGSPGAARIPPAVTQTILYVLEYGLDPMEALRMPRIHASPANRTIQYEQGLAPEVLDGLRRMGYDLEAMPPASLFFGGVHLIDRRGGRWIGAADPRRDGEVRGY
jgi:gamma-glutamyltranspeptidase / glutathione hydrolase